MASGRVYLIGAGPGDPELMTLRAVRALDEADMVLVDELVDERCLAYTKGRIVRVGKRGGCASTPQVFIEKLMIHLAAAGNVVARLKGGDPFIFGRGGEELAALQAAGIPVQVVPGITAGLGIAAELGIPLTRRGSANSVTFVAGHSAQPVDWAGLRAARTTLAIYMAATRLAETVDAMLAGGFPPSMPACIVQNGTQQAQRTVFAPLACLAECAENAGIASPALVLVGEVVFQSASYNPGAETHHVRRHH